MIEFKQTIDRGTRLYEGKDYSPFTTLSKLATGSQSGNY